MKQKHAVSAASVDITSSVRAIGIYPKEATTASIHLDAKTTIDLATNLLLLVKEDNNNDLIIIAGHTSSLQVTIFAASAKVLSSVVAIGVYPKNAKVVSIYLDLKTTIDLATKMLLLAIDAKAKGKRIMITGHPHSLQVTVLRKLL